jgi:hypothetical protein
MKKVEFQKMIKKTKQIWNYCISKEKSEGLIIRMPYVDHFYVRMTM